MEAGPSRKRLRRTTRSCYQCRKRKVKCQLTDEDVETCAECLKSGTQCTLQPLDTDPSSGRSPALSDKRGLESRLERIESLLNKLVETQERSQLNITGSSEPQPQASDLLWNDFLLHSPVDGTLIYDHGRAMAPPADTADATDSRQSLAALLPSAQDAVVIVANTTAWLWGAENPRGSVLTPDDASQLLEIAATTSKGSSAIHIAKTALLFALYMQQLPANFDVQFLESRNVDGAIKLIVERVKLFFTSHEEEACSAGGLECLTLLSLIHLNDGAIRSAWMAFRRILDISRLVGLQNSFSVSARNSPRADIALHRRLWLSTVCGDAYCSLLLGLEPGLGVAPFGPDDEDWEDPLADGEATVHRRICLIVARIAQRNAVGLHGDLHALREIDDLLNRLQDSMPPSWWRVPSFRRDRSLDSAKDPNRLICQLWFFQARIYAHLPIAFGKAAANDSLNSLESCMEASRITLHRYLGIQHAKDHLSRCRTIDQSAFVAAVVLLLGKVHKMPRLTVSRYDSDRALLEQVIDSFEGVGKMCSREHVARQISEILSSMMGVVDADSRDALFTASKSPDSNTPFTSETETETPFDLGLNLEGTSVTAKCGMEDILASSIRPMLDAQSPAARLIDLCFPTKKPAPCVSNAIQTHHTSMQDVMDPATLPQDCL